ncbi:flagellar hook-basal body protein [Paenisporosarcina cavernae]|uniref:Flagellar hook-basal body protein n=1 Tax=Paenisporosarcina cavernae TaxID=2320858 RepID=A0A385YQD4_9BACL|nr:flagellar hook-basal body protein [Paenisporosarcina cavernae]AYC28846.1 flagellar hook-basal body protein [Paenisporosarcina cavernae]
MLRTMLTATNTLNQLQSQIDTIGNNLSNAGTYGYKSRDVKFHELLYQQFQNDKLDQAPRSSPAGIRYGVGAVVGQAEMNWKQGTVQQTGRQLDFAFTTPKQYFQILMPGADGNKTVYTRQGAFYANPTGDGALALVNADGYSVADANGNPIILNETAQNFSLTDGGRLDVQNADGTTDQFDLGITVLQRPQLMEHLSATYITLPDNLNELGVTAQDILTNLQGADRAQIGLGNGQLEQSNVNMSKEFTDLISAQRSYQFNARAVTMGDQMLGLINGIR